jgi:signal transduction histidine kinase
MAEIVLLYPPLLSSQPASPSARRVALAIVLFLLIVVVASLPFARMQLAKFPGFVLIQKSLLMADDLITASLLFGQYAIARARWLCILACGYLFTALIVVPHALTFPGVFSPTGLLGAGPQSSAWLYIVAHAALPLAIIAALAVRDLAGVAPEPPGSALPSIPRAALVTISAVAAVTLFVTFGHSHLAPLMAGDRYTAVAYVAVGALLALPAAVLLIQAKQWPPTLLDLSLMMVMVAWLCTITIEHVLGGRGRYDVGWYLGSIFDWLTSIFVLLTLLFEIIGLYAQYARAVAAERGERERRLAETQAILAHVGRVGDLGQNLASLIHEVNQPLTAIMNYLSAASQFAASAGGGRLSSILERAQEQAARASGIVRHLRDFVARRETEKQIADLRPVLEDGIRLALVGWRQASPTIEIRVDPVADKAYVDRVQIEQVIFNLVRNALEAMADSTEPALVIGTAPAGNGTVEISIADNGPGLSADIREQLFEPFVTTKPTGLGVGLSICRVIVEAHGGRLLAQDNPSGGTVFRFNLPVAAG